MRKLLILLALLSIPSLASAKEGWRDWCWNGGKRVMTSGLQSTTTVQATTASCTVTIYVHGGSTLATIYSDNNGTPLANPFTGSTPNGQFLWYAANGRYDQTVNVTINGSPNTVTMHDILLCDPFELGSTCNNGGSTTAHNLLSTTHLDTIPASPPTQGDIVTAQNQTSPTGVNPSWARLPLGTNGQVLTSNGTDAVWAPVSATGGSITINNSTCMLGSACNSGHHGLEFTIYNGGTALTSGTTVASYALMATVPFACTITRYSLGADQGTATVKFWKVATGTAIPVVGNSINTSGVSLSTGTKVDSATLTDFTTTAIALNDSIIMDITTVAGGMTYLDGVLGCSE